MTDAGHRASAFAATPPSTGAIDRPGSGSSAMATTARGESMRRTMTSYNPASADYTAVRRGLFIDEEPVIDPTQLHNLLREHHDTELAQTVAIDMFDDASSPFMKDFHTKLDELSAEDKAAALNAATAVFKIMLPHILSLQVSALSPLAISAAPHLCSVLNLTKASVKEYDISSASSTMITSLEKLEPIYSKLLAITGNIDKSEAKRTKTQKYMDAADSALLLHEANAEGDEDFNMYNLLSSWTDEERSELMTRCKAAIKTDPTIREHPNRMKWDEIAAGCGDHDDDECESEFGRASAEATLKAGTTAMNTIETRIKSLLKQKDMVMTELSKADVPSSHLSVHDTQKSDGVKFSKLTLNTSALMATCNPKVLISMVRGLNSYFDQHPGSYTLTRVFMNYINTEFLSNNMQIVFPMDSNAYQLGGNPEFSELFSRYLEQESHSLARIMTSISSEMVEDFCESRQIKTSTPEPEMFQANKRCAMSMIYSIFHKHSEKNHDFMKAMKAAVSSLIGLLANKKETLPTLRAIMKKIIQPAKKMNLMVDWEDSCRPILTFLRDQSNSTYMEVIQEYKNPLSSQRHDSIAVLEELVSKMIAIGQKDTLSADITINPSTVLTESTNYASAMAVICHLTGEKSDPELILQTAPVGGGAVKDKPNHKASPDKPNVSASDADKLKFALSAKCGNKSRHVAIEVHQPTSGASWKCGVASCNNSVTDTKVKSMQEYRLSQQGLEQYWQATPCDSCQVKQFFNNLTDKCNASMYKFRPGAAEKKLKWLSTAQKEMYQKLQQAETDRTPIGAALTEPAAEPTGFPAPSIAASIDAESMSEFRMWQQAKRGMSSGQSDRSSLYAEIAAKNAKPSFR